MEFIEFCKATGLRKKELKCLRGTQLVFKNGIYYIAVTSGAKGGRYRESPIITNVDAIVNRMKEAGTGKVWSYVPDMDVHSYRSEYCIEDFLYRQETMEAYTILMDFQIGTRIGELVVLQKEDMLDGEVYIHKMEIVDEERVDGVYIRKGYKVMEYVKHDISAGYRTIPLSKKAKRIL